MKLRTCLVLIAVGIICGVLSLSKAFGEEKKAEAIILIDKDQGKDLQILRLQEQDTLHRYNELFLKWQSSPEVQQIIHENEALERKNQELTKAIYDKAKVTPETYDLDLQKAILAPKPKK